MTDVMTDFETDALWRRIREFDLDDPDSSLPFSRRLARENGWNHKYALAVIEEYRRFCYLAFRAGHPVTPSDEVDQAWHLHLLYTRSYWDEFCPDVLEGPLHHGPTRGGRMEGDKFHDWYQKTLDSYTGIFGAAPPEDIWPPVEARFADAAAFRRINIATDWVLPRPTRFQYACFAGLVISLFLLHLV